MIKTCENCMENFDPLFDDSEFFCWKCLNIKLEIENDMGY